MSVSVCDTSPSRRPRVESYFSNVARVLLSVRSLTATISMSAPEATTARKKLRPIRPNPLIPTRTVTAVAPALSVGWCKGTARPYPPLTVARRPCPTYVRVTLVTLESAVLSEHLRRQRGFGVRDAELLGALVGHREQAADPPG